jgi:hypothetical protein
VSWLDNDPTVIRANDMRADLPTLRLLMEKTYPGWSIAARRGWDWNAWFSSWDLELALAGNKNLPALQAVAPWLTFRQFLLDNHSHPMVLGIEGATLSAQLDHKPSGACTSLVAVSGKLYRLDRTDAGQQPHTVQSWDGTTFQTAAYVAYPDYIGPIDSIRCASAIIHVTMTNQPLLKPGPVEYRDLGNGIGYIRVAGSFSYARDTDLREILAKSTNGDNQNSIVLDVRANGGGAAPIDILSHWFSQAELGRVVRVGSYENLHSCFAVGLQFNLGQEFLMRSLKAPLAPQTKELIQNIMNMIGGDDNPGSCEVKQHRSVSAWTMLEHHLELGTQLEHRPRVIVVVDNECGSDCEGLVTTLAQLPGTVIAGTSTAGTIGFLQPGMFVLPHSRLPFMLAQGYSDVYGDGRSQAGYGLSVDVLLATKESQSISSLKALAEAITIPPQER